MAVAVGFGVSVGVSVGTLAIKGAVEAASTFPALSKVCTLISYIPGSVNERSTAQLPLSVTVVVVTTEPSITS